MNIFDVIKTNLSNQYKGADFLTNRAKESLKNLKSTQKSVDMFGPSGTKLGLGYSKGLDLSKANKAGFDNWMGYKNAIDKGNINVSIPSSAFGGGQPKGLELGYGPKVLGSETKSVKPAEKKKEISKITKEIKKANPEMNYKEIGRFARSWYESKGHPDSAKAAGLVAKKAIENGLDPYMMLALGAQEGGWLKAGAGKNNYFGFGETDSGSMGMGAQDLGSWLDKYLPKYSQPVYGETPYSERNKLIDWGGDLNGLGKGSKYTKRYNYNDSWVTAIADLLGQQEAYRQQYFPEMSPSRIQYNR